MLLSSHSESCLFGGSPRLGGNVNFPSFREVGCNHQNCQGNTERRGSDLQSLILVSRSVESCGPDWSLDGTPSLQEHPTTTCQNDMSTIRMANNCPNLPVTEKHRGVNLVAVPRGSGVQWPPLQLPAFDMTISTDASLLGWGATWPGTTIGGRWLPAEANSHINLLELKAALLALQAFFRTYTPTPRHILLQMDNSTALAYVNKREGTRSYGLSTEALKLWALVLHAGCWITAKHIPGTSNTIADLASRKFTSCCYPLG